MEEQLKKFSAVKILIVGDVMIDRYSWGSVSRISPEAPVPVVALEKTSSAAGGAANVAANVAGLGATPILFGITGDDVEAADLPEILREANITNFNLTALKNRQTSIKTRIVANNQHVVRIDRETVQPITKKESAQIFTEICKVIKDAKVILISDYAKGFLTEDLLSRLITNGNKKNKIILIDPKGKDFSKYRGATILTPNQRETAEACHLEEQRQDLIDKAAKTILEDLSLRALLVTQGAKGMTLLEKDKKALHLKASARKVFDVTGAGDTVIASLAVALGSGMTFAESANFANLAAGLVVEQVGTTAITQEMLINAETRTK